MDLEYESYAKSMKSKNKRTLSYEQYYRVINESKTNSKKLLIELQIEPEDIILALAYSLDFYVANKPTPFTMPELSPEDIKRTTDLMKSMGIDSQLLTSFNK